MSHLPWQQRDMCMCMVTLCSLMYYTASITDDVHVSFLQVSMEKRLVIDHLYLAKTWDITPEQVTKIIWATAQREIQIVLHTYLSQRFSMNNPNLWHWLFTHPIFTETTFTSTSTVFNKGNKYGQVHITSFSWISMYARCKAHEGCSHYLQLVVSHLLVLVRM